MDRLINRAIQGAIAGIPIRNRRALILSIPRRLMRAYLHHDAADLSTSNRGDHK